MRIPIVIAVAASIFCAGVSGASPLEKSPPPSMVKATLLKDNPPHGWIKHYLGDDRYILASGIWQVVSTETDTYYHRPDCPRMLRQQAGKVIGFASKEDAEEAGYSPCPECMPEAPRGFGSFFGGFSNAVVNRGKSPKRLTLADGVSTVELPSNWERLMHMSNSIPVSGQTMHYTIDSFKPLQGRGTVTVSTMTGMPYNGMLNDLSAAKVKQGMAQFGQYINASATLDSQTSHTIAMMQSAFKNMDVSDTRLGNINAVELKYGSALKGIDHMIMAAQGDKLIYVMVMQNPSRGATALEHSIRLH